MIIEGISNMSEADLKAWCFKQISFEICMEDRINQAERLRSWILSSQDSSEYCSTVGQSEPTEERYSPKPQLSESH